MLRPLAGRLLPDLQLSLGVGILTALNPTTGTPGLWHAALPRDFEEGPDARATLVSTAELVSHRPYLGEWIEVERGFVNEKSRLEPDGHYVWGAGVGV